MLLHVSFIYQLAHFYIVLSFILTSQVKYGVRGDAHGIQRRSFGLNAIDSIFVIHLQSRDDRLQHINGVMESLGVSKHKIVNGVKKNLADWKVSTCAVYLS